MDIKSKNFCQDLKEGCWRDEVKRLSPLTRPVIKEKKREKVTYLYGATVCSLPFLIALSTLWFFSLCHPHLSVFLHSAKVPLCSVENSFHSCTHKSYTMRDYLMLLITPETVKVNLLSFFYLFACFLFFWKIRS